MQRQIPVQQTQQVRPLPAVRQVQSDAAALVYVTNVTLDPEVFYPGETGVVTITLKNDGSTSVGLTDPDIMSDKVHVVKKDTWDTMSFIGAGATLSYSFQIKVDPPDGNIFALFTVATKDAGSIHFPFIVKVDSKNIRQPRQENWMHLRSQLKKRLISVSSIPGKAQLKIS